MHLSPVLLEHLRAAKRVTVLTGAGVSAESGVPTFREAQSGLWARFQPEELATPGAFMKNPRLVWEWYAWRRELVSAAKPNPGHLALAEWEKRVPRFSLITQNVDGLHQLAGSQNVIELHGNIHRTKCWDEDQVVDQWEETGEIPPSCPRCGGLLRPDVVWFEESLPESALQAATEAASATDLFLSVGTSSVVYPAAGLIPLAMKNGAIVVEINPVPTSFAKQVDYSIPSPAGVALPALLQAIQSLD